MHEIGLGAYGVKDMITQCKKTQFAGKKKK